MFTPEIETRTSGEIKKYQDKRLKELIKFLNSNSPYYSALFKKEKILPEKIKSLDDLRHIPTTSKQDLQQHNHDFICVPKNKLIDYTTTSGTLGEPVMYAMTDKDLDRLAYNEYISFTCAEGGSDDIYQLMTTMDRRFMAGLAYFLGARKLGAGIIRVGGGLPELQWDSIQKFSPTALITVPSFLLRMIEFADNNGIDCNASGVKKAICIGEPIRNSNLELNTLGKKITEQWNIQLFSTYASTEMATAFTECREVKGGHHHPELIIVELLDEQEQPVREGEFGEVTVSTLGVEAMPLLRFKTGDICTYFTEPCPCGRNTMRLGPVIGRKQQMIKYKGTTLYPASIYEVLDDFSPPLDYVVEISTNDIGTDSVVIRIAGTERDLGSRIKEKMKSKLRVLPEVTIETYEQIARLKTSPADRKPIKFIDKRNFAHEQ